MESLIWAPADLVMGLGQTLLGTPVDDGFAGRAAYRDALIGEPIRRVWNADKYERAEIAGEVFTDVVVSSAIGTGAYAARAGISAGKKAASTPGSSNNLNSHVAANLAESKIARDGSNFLVLPAKESQIIGGYNVDEWTMTTLRKGDIVYGGLPGQSAFYTTKNTLLRHGYNPDALFGALQVKPHPVLGYRKEVGLYQLTRDIRVPVSKATANPAFGSGQGNQFHINSFNSTFKLSDRIELGGGNYGPQLPPYRSRP